MKVTFLSCYFANAFTSLSVRFAAKFSEDEEERELVPSVKRIRNYCTKVSCHLTDDISRMSSPLVLVENTRMNSCLLAESSTGQLSREVEGIENVESKVKVPDYMLGNASKEFVANDEVAMEDSKKGEKFDLASRRQEVEDLSPSFNINLSDIPPEIDLNKMPSLGEECEIIPAAARVMHSVTEEQLTEPSTKAKVNQRHVVPPVLQTLNKPLGSTDVWCLFNEPEFAAVHNFNYNLNIDLACFRIRQSQLPNFDSYIVEEEEGSGGYGTVYRARRKNDGALVALKCPHANAHKIYVNNELKMLERLGSENSDCFVLQYVEHDRPEVLKKEIDVFQLKWYAFCLFKALANLHRQRIVHRDVKLGNFLFSRKTNKGYLIDFNLAMEMHQKYRSTEFPFLATMVPPDYHFMIDVAFYVFHRKSKLEYDLSYRNTTPFEAIHPTDSSKFLNMKSREGINIVATKGSRLTLEPKNMRKTTVQRKAPHNDLSSWNKINSQGGDGSGITSTKDASARTPSAERPRKPFPCQGRKELIRRKPKKWNQLGSGI
ncbi:Detected protein of unknown function [Hibiscus syriacus]|uniref:non-specific serine/threonine protein kinase n=1 Tax=Hibiscus syriacus TaxID=106335 RepID=A0A6A3CPZ6_HIBSY|nr:Detected protein of unknown function [Hibiscus syriacus]